jgi:PII-like signaling protein
MSQGTLVRIYLTEQDGHLQELMDFLHDQETLSGLTVFRGSAGFGPSGRVHGAGLIDLSLDLPLVLEFFDQAAKVASVLADLRPRIAPGHLVSWPIDLD